MSDLDVRTTTWLVEPLGDDDYFFCMEEDYIGTHPDFTTVEVRLEIHNEDESKSLAVPITREECRRIGLQMLNAAERWGQ